MDCKFCRKSFEEKIECNGIKKLYCSKNCRKYQNNLNSLLRRKQNQPIGLDSEA